LSRQVRRTSTQCRSQRSSAALAVEMARRSSEVCTMSGSSPASASSSPARPASVSPRWDSGTSTHPVKRFSAFQVLSP
jgi:hypothetical protein